MTGSGRIKEIIGESAEIGDNKELSNTLQEEFENIIFKDNKEEIKELAVGDYYNDLVEEIMGFLLKMLIEQREKFLKSMNTTAQKNMKN